MEINNVRKHPKYTDKAIAYIQSKWAIKKQQGSIHRGNSLGKVMLDGLIEDARK